MTTVQNIKKYPAYPEYKPSGFDWIGNIPKEWEARRIKLLCKVSRGASPRPIDDEKYFNENGEYAWVRIADLTASERYLENTTQRLSDLGKSLSVPLEPGEIFLSIAGTVGKPIITKIKCCIHDGFVYFINLKYSRELLYYIFSAGEAYKGLGKLGTQLNLNTDTVGNISIPLIPPEDQKKIVSFLDRETCKIDSVINKKQKLIELLKEKRQTLITHAVTKGLNPKAKMKHSGIDWLGDIPKEWNVKRLKYVSDTRISNVDKKSDDEIQVQLCNYVDVYKNEFIDDKIEFMQATATLSQVENFELKMDDVLITKDSETSDDIGIPAYVSLTNTKGIVCGYHLAQITTSKKIISGKYLFRLLQADNFKGYFDFSSNGVTRFGLGTYPIINVSIPLPPVEEQKTISAFLDCTTGIINKAITKIENQIEFIKEYRATLISNAVTGKIMVN